MGLHSIYPFIEKIMATPTCSEVEVSAMPLGGLFVRLANPKQQRFAEMGFDELKRERQSIQRAW